MSFSLKDLKRGQALPNPVELNKLSPENYVASDELVAAAETAIILGQPLLLTGEPGCGKSSFADYLRHLLCRARPLRAYGRSSMDVADLFYRYDEIGRYQDKGRRDPASFLALEGLGEAVLRASDPGANVDLRIRLLPDDKDVQSREVVLIDEIDKAPRDVPNDLLALISGTEIRLPIPELSREGERVDVAAPLEKMPILIVTSNSEKSLPEPFLRRCVYHHIEFPTDDARLAEILHKRIVGLSLESALVQSAISVVRYIRSQPVRKQPSLAELIGFVQILLARGWDAQKPLSGDSWHPDAAATLLKVQDDRDNAENLLAGR